MENNSLFARYKSALAGLCYYAAWLSKVKEQIKTGEVIDEGKLEFYCTRVEVCKRHLLECKEALGYSDGLAFMNNANFAGFSIKNGELIGDRANIYKILMPWYNNFPEKGNNFLFEVANFLLAFEAVEDEGKPLIEQIKEERTSTTLVTSAYDDVTNELTKPKKKWWQKLFRIFRKG